MAEGPNSPGHFQQQHQQAAVQDPVQAVVCLFDLSMLRYKERDLLLETFQQYRQVRPCCMPSFGRGRKCACGTCKILACVPLWPVDASCTHARLHLD